jgi:hypothetical protein
MSLAGTGLAGLKDRIFIPPPLSLGDWNLARTWPMSYRPLTGPSPQNNIYS